MAVAPPDAAASTIFGLARALLPPQLADRLYLKTYDDPACDTMRLAIFFKTGMEQQRWGYDVTYKEWQLDPSRCIQIIEEWVAGVLHAVMLSGGGTHVVKQAVAGTVVLPAGMDKWAQDGPPRKPKAPPKPPAVQAKPEPPPVPGERHIEIE